MLNWIDPKTDMPERDMRYNNLSVNVLIFHNFRVTEAFFDYYSDTWRTFALNSETYVHDTVTRWAYFNIPGKDELC
jgi:hypothetical protein